MEEDCHRLLQPLIPSSTSQNSVSASSILRKDDNDINHDQGAFASSNSGIVFRFGLILVIGMLSLWANHQTSKGHSISIVNEANDTAQGRCFDLFFASNGKASRLVYDTSKFVENFLYPNASYPKKQVKHVILRLSIPSMLESLAVESSPSEGECILYIRPSLMDEINRDHAMFLTVQKGMARIWLWDGVGDQAPSSLLNGIVEYISQLSLGGIKSSEKMDAHPDCWRSKNPQVVAEFFNYYEMKKPGFIRRLNQELRNGWNDQHTVDEALGMPNQHLCASHNSSILSIH